MPLSDFNKAERHIHVADHMLTQTFPLLKDPKLLLATLDHIFLALSNGLAAIYNSKHKIPAPFERQIIWLKMEGISNIDREEITFIEEINSMIKNYKKSAVTLTK